jgi:hypothetical protein
MFARTTPRVYFEWEERQAPPTLARTDVAGFVGIAERGPLHTPRVVENWSDFRQLFGGHIAAGYLAYAVEGFFLNGGRRCYVVRVADPQWARCAKLDLVTKDGSRVLRLSASSRGDWGNRLAAEVLPLGNGRFNLTLRFNDLSQELWPGLVLNPNPDVEPPALNLLNGEIQDRPGSTLVRASIIEPDPREGVPQLVVDHSLGTAYFKGGEDGLWTLRPAHLSGRGAPGESEWGLATLEGIPEVAIVAMPDLMPAPVVPVRYRIPPVDCDELDEPPPQPPPPDPDHPPAFSDVEIRELQRELVGHCTRLRDRIAVLDTRRQDTHLRDVEKWRNQFDSSYAALYFPWLRVPDPLRLTGLLRTIPPSGHMAGLYARVENISGVQQPPANEPLENVRDLTIAAEDVAHGFLNERAVNVIRAYPARGLRPMGARTLSSDSQMRYVSVRRILLALERTLRMRTPWLVFEPSNPELQAEVARVLRGLLDDFWLRGMLDGATADEAYRVICDETSNPPAETEAGRLLAEVIIRPPYPAEFVVVRVGRTDQGIQFLEGSEA